MSENKYLKEVRDHYESLPYPGRDPEDEKTRLLKTSLDFLPRINHYGFAGRRDLSDPFRVLVAGGGTGDAVIYLAEQLREYSNAKITYIDISTASLEIARKRAEIRNLNNIEWLHGSLLELNQEEHGSFDYINCSGVLHHLDDPLAGLLTLKSVLARDGVMGIMVYAQYGRTGVYQIQDLMRHVNKADSAVEEKVDNTRRILESLPDSNWFKRAEELHEDHIKYGDIGIYDLFLHSQDRAYTIPELFAWLKDADLKFIAFANGALEYDPRSYIQDRDLLSIILEKPKQEQYAITELLTGDIIKHTFYCGMAENTIASISGEKYPVFADPGLLVDIQDNMRKEYYGDNYLVKKNNFKITIPINEFTQEIFAVSDGKYSFVNIAKQVAARLKVKQEEIPDLTEQIINLFQLLVDIDDVYLSEIKPSTERFV